MVPLSFFLYMQDQSSFYLYKPHRRPGGRPGRGWAGWRHWQDGHGRLSSARVSKAKKFITQTRVLLDAGVLGHQVGVGGHLLKLHELRIIPMPTCLTKYSLTRSARKRRKRRRDLWPMAKPKSLPSYFLPGDDLHKLSNTLPSLQGVLLGLIVNSLAAFNSSIFFKFFKEWFEISLFTSSLRRPRHRTCLLP